MDLISIDKEKCTKCGKCKAVCPVSIIYMNDENYPQVSDDREQACINCGHCESVCPDHALTHRLTQQTVLKDAYKFGAVDSEKIENYFRSRRSMRNFLQKPVTREVWDKVMDVVRYAPTGTNSQRNQWIIISDKETIKKLGDATIDWMRKISESNTATSGGYNFMGIVNSYERGKDRICRNAPNLVISYGDNGYRLGAVDAIIATTHLEILLPNYGLGACWAGFLMMAFQYYPEMKKIVGLGDNDKVHAILMAGYPKFQYYREPVRNKPDIKWL
jgi:nitroreductase/NAD-dependent dihydropyrimidine dehydrogenase PreA subunit